VFIVRERDRFWRSRPSRALLLASAVDAALVFVIATVGIPKVAPIPPAQSLTVLGLTAACSFGLNDLVKVASMRRAAVASGGG
jgi:H+-transporting ATPase